MSRWVLRALSSRKIRTIRSIRKIRGMGSVFHEFYELNELYGSLQGSFEEQCCGGHDECGEDEEVEEVEGDSGE